MKSFLLLLFTCGVVHSFSQPPARYKPFPAGTRLDIDTVVAGSINALIEELDTDFLFKGRDVAAARDPDIAAKVLRAAMVNGGNAESHTYFDDFFDDSIIVSVHTVYDVNSLVKVRWESLEIREVIAISGGGRKITAEIPGKERETYIYRANIKVQYTVTVDGKTKTGDYWQKTTVNSPVKMN